VIAQKYVVAWEGEPLEFGRRVQAQARRRGLAQAQAVAVVADGSVWIWNVQADRFGRAQGVLDFYHASQHLWSVGHALHPGDEAAARAWVEPLLSQLRHGQEAGVLQTLEALPAWCAQQQRVVPPEIGREREYFQSYREHVHYEAMAARGCPVGSWSDGILLRAVAMALQTVLPVLDSARVSFPGKSIGVPICPRDLSFV
jgi:hypothetical protein